MKGKTVMVTGANSGIGFQAAQALARQGATVVCVCRDKTRGEKAAADIRAAGGGSVELMLADLSSQASIRALAADFRARHQRLDVLLNNAGVVVPERRVTADGYEATFALNHLGYFLLTHLLLDVLKASAPSRIVNLASEAERMGSMDFNDLMFERRAYKALSAYGTSKLANIMFTYDLAKKLEGTGVSANAMHPGGVATRFGEDFHGLLGVVMKAARPFMRSPAKGAETAIWLASSPQAEGVTGQYFHDRKPIRSIATSYDPTARARLWEVSERLTGLVPARAS